MRYYSKNKIAPTSRDGRWVVTHNRVRVWSGKCGWSLTAKLGTVFDPKAFTKPGGNAKLFDSRSDAEELIVRYALLGQAAAEATLLNGRFTTLPEAGISWRRNNLMETAVIQNGVLVWDTVWVVARDRVYAADVTNSPHQREVSCFIQDHVFESAKLFKTLAEADAYAGLVPHLRTVSELTQHGHVPMLSGPERDYP